MDPRKHIQLDLFEQAASSEGGMVRMSRTSLGAFGNRTDVIVVTPRYMGGASLLEPALGIVHVDGQGIISK